MRSTPKARGYPLTRLRRTRSSDWSRRLHREANLHVADLILPIFVCQDESGSVPIASMPGVERHSVKSAVYLATAAYEAGIPAIALFPETPAERKDADGSEALNPNNLVNRTVRAIKSAVPDIGLITDVALDPYTDHGHDGLLKDGCILNDETVEVLVGQALIQAQAGADIIAPSDMMDGRVGAIRVALDREGFEAVQIMAYAAKYASAFYGPFRDAVGAGELAGGDKSTYQMDPANADEAIREVELDIREGADSVMVKPAMPYLDIIRMVRERFRVPTFAYQVSGEYAMLQAAAGNDWLDLEGVMMESLMSIKRAGATGILTYFALDAAAVLGR